MPDISDVIAHSERVDRARVPGPNRYIIERHLPTRFGTPYHHHTSVEINFLEGCEMVYAFSDRSVHLKPDDIAVFWGAAPHRVTDVIGRGRITNIYLSLAQFLRWSLPDRLAEAILSGCVISVRAMQPFDGLLFDRLYRERGQDCGAWRQIHLDEIGVRLRRIGLEGWTTRIAARDAPRRLHAGVRSMLHVEAMLRFIADNFSRPVAVDDIARAVHLSPSHATTLFREIMGVSIKVHLTRTRLSHARMLLAETEQKIVSIALDSGFRNLSGFYEAFRAANGVTPARFRQDVRAPVAAGAADRP